MHIADTVCRAVLLPRGGRSKMKGEEQGMKHEFLAVVTGIADGVPNEVDVEPPAIARAYGLSGDEVEFSLRGAARRDAAKWFGRRVRVIVETIGDE